MNQFKIGDIVTRKSYGNDILFRIASIITREGKKPAYNLMGLVYRIQADSPGEDLVRLDPRRAYLHKQNELYNAKRHAHPYTRGSFIRPFIYGITRGKTGKILHIDSDEEYLRTCLRHYKNANLMAVGKVAEESRQPQLVRGLLEQHRPNILVVTGHDAIKKNAQDKFLMDNYRNSKYFVNSVKEARKFESSHEKLCIFAGACQSYYEVIMDAGANFASSPGRILINALDPTFVAERVAITDKKYYVTPQQISRITISGSAGIGGINTRGQMN